METSSRSAPVGTTEVEIITAGRLAHRAPLAGAPWFKLVGVNLGNASADYPNGDDALSGLAWAHPPNERESGCSRANGRP
jgi:hypothetical protein